MFVCLLRCDTDSGTTSWHTSRCNGRSGIVIFFFFFFGGGGEGPGGGDFLQDVLCDFEDVIFNAKESQLTNGSGGKKSL